MLKWVWVVWYSICIHVASILVKLKCWFTKSKGGRGGICPQAIAMCKQNTKYSKAGHWIMNKTNKDFREFVKISFKEGKHIWAYLTHLASSSFSQSPGGWVGWQSFNTIVASRLASFLSLSWLQSVWSLFLCGILLCVFLNVSNQIWCISKFFGTDLTWKSYQLMDWLFMTF